MNHPLYEQFMRQAIAIAKNSTGSDKTPFGALVVLHGECIARAHNQIQSKKDPTCHAEVNVIRQACQKRDTLSLKGGTLYTACEPCPT